MTHDLYNISQRHSYGSTREFNIILHLSHMAAWGGLMDCRQGHVRCMGLLHILRIHEIQLSTFLGQIVHTVRIAATRATAAQTTVTNCCHNSISAFFRIHCWDGYMHHTLYHLDTTLTSIRSSNAFFFSGPFLKSSLEDPSYSSYVTLPICTVLCFLSFLCSMVIREYSSRQLSFSFT